MKIDAKTAQNISIWFFLIPVVLVVAALAVTLVVGLIRTGPLGWFGLGVIVWFLVSVALNQWARHLYKNEINGKY